jgi:hypothetical protein
MIGSSRFRRSSAALAALLVTGATSMSCNLIGRSCNGTNCGDTYAVTFDRYFSGSGLFDGGAVDGGPPAGAIRIDFADQRSQDLVTFETCWLTAGSDQQLACSSSDGSLYLANGSGLFLPHLSGTLVVTMSKDGNQLSSGTPSSSVRTYTCGCGDATAKMTTYQVSLPPPDPRDAGIDGEVDAGTTDGACAADACDDGLTIVLDGVPVRDTTYTIAIDDNSSQHVPALSCTFTSPSAGNETLACSGNVSHAEPTPRTIRMPSSITNLGIRIRRDHTRHRSATVLPAGVHDLRVVSNRDGHRRAAVTLRARPDPGVVEHLVRPPEHQRDLGADR